MRRTTVILALFALVSPGVSAQSDLPDPVQCLIQSYPDVICGFAENNIKYCDGSTSIWDDGKKKTPQEAIENADMEDQFRFAYKTGATSAPLERFDPGRIRNQTLFRKLYGSKKKSVAQSIVTVSWFGKTVRINKRYGVAKKLEKVRDEVAGLPKPVREKVEEPSGGFVWRNIKGTDRRSAHSWGIAVDVGVNHSDYWKWNKPKNGKYPYKNRIPLEVVEIFEKHGFIWGGKWYHYDTMHFEYRPELICAGNP